MSLSVKAKTAMCAVCGTKKWRDFCAVTSSYDKRTYKLVQCLNCGLVCVSDLPGEQELSEYYSTYSYSIPKVWNTSQATLRSLDILLDKFQRFKTHGTLLDVGCGTGLLLKLAKARGWQTFGVDISIAAVTRLQGEGLTVHHGDLCSATFADEQFDVVVMTELIEHLLEPARYIRESHRILRTGGALYLTTPNFNSITRRLAGQKWRIIGPPEHLFYFSSNCLSRLLRRCGFKYISICTEGINPYEIIRAFRNEKTCESYNCAATSTEMLRDRIVNNPFLQWGKKILNACLSLTKCGDSLKVIAIK